MSEQTSETGFSEHDEDLESQYAAVLDSLLFPPNMKAELIKSQTIEKKRQMVAMHQKAIEKETLSTWTEKENNILMNLMKSKTIEVKSLTYLKTILTTANKLVLSSFIQSSGIIVLIKCINDRVAHVNITELDAVILYEIVSCLKVTMNNETGMLAVLETPDAIEAIARCLLFEWRALSSLVLEILSCCCYYSETAAKAVVDAIRQWSVGRGEKSFAGLLSVFSSEDINSRYDVMSLINQMIMAEDDIVCRSILRDEFNRLQLTERVKLSIKSAEKELAELEACNGSRNDFLSIVGSRSFEIGASRLNPSTLSQQSKGSPVNMQSSSSSNIGAITIKQLTEATPSDVKQGIMVGFCITSNAQANTKNMVADYLGFGSKKAKRRWCVLDGDIFTWSTEKDVDTNSGTIHVSNIIDVRNFSTDQVLVKLSNFCFELETNDRVYAFGCDTLQERNNWVTASRIARDRALVSSSEFRNKLGPIPLEEAKEYLEQLKKNLSLYESIWLEDRQYTTTPEGLDTGNFNDIFRFVHLQSIAANTEAKLHELLYQLVVLPPGMEGMFDSVIASARKYRALGEDCNELDVPIITSSKDKNYQQMSKLALLVITAENEVKALRQNRPAVASSTRRFSAGMRQTFSDLSKENLIALNEEASPVNLTNDIISEKMVKVETILETSKHDDQISPKSYGPIVALDEATLLAVPEANDKVDARPSVAPSTIAAPVSEATSSVPDPRFDKYVKMKKNMLPDGAIRHKMTLDNISDQEIDDFLSGKIPTVSTASTTSSSTPAVEAPVVESRYAKFIKMKGMLPEGAVRQKMSLEGFTQQEIDDFMSGKLPTASTTTAPSTTTASAQISTDELRYAKFVKMKGMLPEGAVRQKMSLEGFTQEEIDDFMSGKLPAASSAPLSSAAPAQISADELRYAKFVKMKGMLPEGAVRQKMSLEGFSDQEIDNFLRGNTQNVSAAPPSPANDIASNPIYEKYTKMLKMLPEGAVRQKMTQDGIAPEDIDKFFNPSAANSAGVAKSPAAKKPPAPAVHVPPPGFKPKPVVTPKKKLKALFWTKLSNDVIGQSVWKKVEDFSFTSIETTEMEDWFSAPVKKTNEVLLGDDSKGGRNGSPAPAKAAVKLVSLMDGKKIQNVLIAMGKLRMSAPVIAESIIQLDESVLTLEITETLLGIAPSSDEMIQVKNYDGKESGLDRASALYWHICKIPRLQFRLECHALIFKWFYDVEHISARYQLLMEACNEVKQSEKDILKLLSVVLAIGNYMNGGSARGQAYGIKLEVLKKLSTIKAESSDRGSIVHFIVNVVRLRAPELIAFCDSWKALWNVNEMTCKDLERDVKRLVSLLDKVKSEYKEGLPKVLSEGGEPMARPLRVRLEKFMTAAEPMLKNMEKIKNDTHMAVSHMAESFGESGDINGDEDPGQLVFDPILSFARSFKQAYEDILLQQKKAEKAKSPVLPPTQRRSTILDPSVSAQIAKEAQKKASENIFAHYNKSKTASTESIVQEFRYKNEKKRSVHGDGLSTSAKYK